jgi:hypothetical protein
MTILILEGNECIAHVVCDALSIDKTAWHFFKETVRSAIRLKRAASNTALRKVYLGKPCFFALFVKH